MSEVAEVLRQCGGTATFALLRRFLTARAIRSAVADGHVHRIAKGVYTLPPATDALTAARAQGGIVSHLSAARLHGFEVLELPSKPQVTVPRGQHLRRSPLSCELHWADDVPSDGGVTGTLRTILDCARTSSFAAGLVVADSALRLDAVDRSRLLTAAAALTGPGSRRARRVALHADGRAESALESALRAILVDARIDGFELQVVVRDEAFSARIDLAHPARMIALEADSFSHHGSRSALTRDCRRHANLTIRGWRLLRFSWEDIMLDPGWVVEAVRRAMAGPSGHNNRRCDARLGCETTRRRRL